MQNSILEALYRGEVPPKWMIREESAALKKMADDVCNGLDGLKFIFDERLHKSTDKLIASYRDSLDAFRMDGFKDGYRVAVELTMEVMGMDETALEKLLILIDDYHLSMQQSPK